MGHAVRGALGPESLHFPMSPRCSAGTTPDKYRFNALTKPLVYAMLIKSVAYFHISTVW